MELETAGAPQDDHSETDPASASAPPGEVPPSLVVLIARLWHEPAADLAESQAHSEWVAVSAPWHPRLLRACKSVPRLESIDQAQPARAGEVRLLADMTGPLLPAGYESSTFVAGCQLMEAGVNRPALVESLLHALSLATEPETAGAQAEELAELVEDFHALGTCHALMVKLSRLMGHSDVLNEQLLTAEVLPAADAWCRGDATGARNRLRAAFEVLSQARERFFPIDSYVVDLVLLDPQTPPPQVEELLARRVAVNLIATGAAIDSLGTESPTLARKILDGVNDGWVDVIGGPYIEAEESLLPLESVVSLYRRGAEAYRKQLDERTVETLGRRRFGLYPLQPQVARRFGMRYGLPMAFDSGRFPTPKESKRIWEAPDGSSLESLTRIPLGADRWVSGAQFASRLAWSMKNDHVAVLPLVHWPVPVVGWYEDLRHAACYASVFGRWVTAGDFFHLSDRPWEVLRPGVDAFTSPYLMQATATGSTQPVSGLVRKMHSRGSLDALLALDGLGKVMSRLVSSASDAPETVVQGTMLDPAVVVEPSEPEPEPAPDLEAMLEFGGDAENRDPQTAELLEAASRALAEALGAPIANPTGWLVFNTLPFARRVPLRLELDQVDLRPLAKRALSGAGFQPDSRLVELPAFGFVWLGQEAVATPLRAVKCEAESETRILRSSRLEVGFDAVGGGLKGIRRPGEPNWRLGLQLVALGLRGADGQARSSVMAARGFEIEISRSDLVQAVSVGEIHDPEKPDLPLARFELRVQLWEDRPTLEIEVRLSDINAEWHRLLKEPGTDPWSNGVALRWAWPDANAVLRRSSHLNLENTTAERPETSEVFEIVTRAHHTALLTGGLSYHQRKGARMLDTLLVVGAEEERQFRVGVALDLESPISAALDRLCPAVAVPVASPPASASAGWFLNLDQRNVQVTRVEFAERTYDGQGWGMLVHLLESGNRPTRCKLRLFLNPQWARQVDCQGDLIVDLSTTDDSVLVDLTPRELACIEITLGLHADRR